MNKILPFFLFFFSFPFFVSCTIRVGENNADRQTSSQTSAETVEEEEDHLSFIGAGDKINIQVYNEKELSGVYQVSPEGYINFPFIGEIKVDGLNIFTLASLLLLPDELQSVCPIWQAVKQRQYTACSK